MSLQVYYEDSFNSERSRSAGDLLSEVISTSKGLFLYVQECKTKFLSGKDWNGIKVLELGAGRGGVGLHLARLGADVTLVDFSPSAIEQAEKVFSVEGLPVKTLVADVTYPDVQLTEKYDIIVDSHLLHCLTGDPDRTSYYGLVRDHLAPHGIFVVETMVHRKKLFVPDGFMFDQNFVLWQMFGKWTPVRKIMDSLDLEAELKSVGFNIVYFMYYAQYSFVPHKSFMEIPNEVLPAAVRLVVQNTRAF
jgi:2-polyprenyl-3-methyl-5-hydroxy-6-metoxy-1,4-benzoquinol methylase